MSATQGWCGHSTDQFDFRFWIWLRNAHPDVYVETSLWDLQSRPGWRTDPAHPLIAVQHVDEFIAQSDDYPLEVES